LAVKFSKRKLEVIENHPEKWKNNPLIYLNAMSDLGTSYGLLQDHHNLLLVLDKIKTIPEKTIHIKVRKFELHSTMALVTFNRMGEDKKALDLVSSISKGLNQYKEKVLRGIR